jgi:hypothetical protein
MLQKLAPYIPLEVQWAQERKERKERAKVQKAISARLRRQHSQKAHLQRDSIPLSSPVQLPEPTGHYVYAYIDPRTHEPFYVGKGHRNRLTRHLTRRYLRKRFYNKLNKMLSEGVLPVVLVIKDNLTEKQAFQSEMDLIQLVGTRKDGVGPLCNIRTDGAGAPAGYTLEQGIKKGTAVKVWGKMFPSLRHVALDERCKVNAATLRRHIKAGIPIKEAVYPKQPKRKPPMNTKPVTCWNQEFPSIKALVKDKRCLVTASTFSQRLRKGWSVEEAAGTRRKEAQGKPRICWGEKFPSLAAVSRDPRCVVTFSQLQNRVSMCWSVQRAATTPIDKVASRRVK